MVGFYQETSGGSEHAFLYSDGTYTILNFPEATRTLGYDINAKGQVVGFYADSSGGDMHGFLYSGGNYSTIESQDGGTDVFSINAKGQILGFYSDGSTNHGLLATAVNVPGGGHAYTDFNSHVNTIQLPHTELHFSDFLLV